MDEADFASRYEQVFLVAALKNCARGITGGESAEVCDECGEDIPEARRVAVPGCRLCVKCKDKAERGF